MNWHLNMSDFDIGGFASVIHRKVNAVFYKKHWTFWFSE